MSVNKNDILKVVDDHADLIARLGDEIWDAAEIAYTEVKSAEYLASALEKEGFQVQRGVAEIPTAFTARYGSGKPVIGILGEYDALYGLSQKAGATEKVAEIPGACGHGCGHNLLGAGSVGAALAVKKYLDEGGKGTVVYFGCPAEEGGAGKVFMARAGLFDELDCAITWHPSFFSSISVDSFLANYQVSYRFKGISSHAAIAPHKGRSALDALELMNVGVQFLREHIIQEARVHYAITDAGGISPNVVQPNAEALYLIRAPKMPQVQEIYERINKIARGAAMMTETEVEIQFVKALANVIPNRTLAQVMQRCAEAIPASEYTEEEKVYARSLISADAAAKDAEGFLRKYRDPQVAEQLRKTVREPLQGKIWPLMDIEDTCPASSDLGDVSWICPSVQLCHTTCAAGTVSHSWQMVAQGKTSVAHKGMVYAAKVMASTAVELFENPQLIAEARKELDQRLGEDKYVNPIPAEVKPPIPQQK